MRDVTEVTLAVRSRMDRNLAVAWIQEGGDVQAELLVLEYPVESSGTSLVLTEAWACP